MRLLRACPVLVLLAGCGGNGGSASATASPASAASGAVTVKLGIDLPLSGADASDGKPTANGADLAIDEADARGIAGGRIVVIADTLDDAVQGKHDPAAGAQNVKTFIDDPAVLAMVGPFNSNVAKSEIPLTNDAGLTQIGPSVVADGLTVGPDATSLRSAHPDINAFFRVCTRNSKQGAALASFAKKNGWKRIYVIDDDETYGKDLADVFAMRFAAGGGLVVGRDHLTANQQDFKALLTKAKSLAPQAVFFGGTTSTGGGLIRRQMADVGMGTLPFLGGDGISDQEFISVAGSEADGTYYTVAAPDAAKLPSARAFVAAYTKRYGAAPGPYSANAFAAAQIAIAAIEKAALADPTGPTRAEVRQNVAATHLATPVGTVGFDRNGDTTVPLLTLVQITHGAPHTVDEMTLPPG